MSLLQTWRWFGPNDTVKLSDAKQAGAQGIVSALHHIKCGEIWPIIEIKNHKTLIENAGLHWAVVESLAVHEAIKIGASNRDYYINNYIESLHNLASENIKTVCYNFMPVLDWTRTEIDYQVEDGSKALRFDNLDYIAFELFVLNSGNESNNHLLGISSELIQKATAQWQTHSPQKQNDIERTLLLGLPGTVDDLTLPQFRDMLAAYAHISQQTLRDNLAYFLHKVVPIAESLGMKMTIHPDDPPRPIFGLPRIMSTENDAIWLTTLIDSPANGLCFCSGSFGARLDNDLPGIIKRLGDKINFVHLRSVQHQSDGSFFEANHLEGNADMGSIMYELVRLQHQRGVSLPMRPDHGHQMLDDLNKPLGYFGYSAIGRLRGLAELRGLEMGIEKVLKF